MNDRERARAVMEYRNYDRMPVMHFGFWKETHEEWFRQGRLSREELEMPEPQRERHVAGKLGFDTRLGGASAGNAGLFPPFERKTLETLPDGSKKVSDENGVIILETPGARSIPMEFDHLLKDRQSWEEHFKPRLQFSPDRIFREQDMAGVRALCDSEAEPVSIWCGSAIGATRNWIGVENLAYMSADDPELLEEITETVSDLHYKIIKIGLEAGLRVDYGSYWEDICYKNGPLVSPPFFSEVCGPVYRRNSELLKKHGVEMSWLDCDGMIDALIPTWIENGVNIMFPIEVGTWGASIRPWREKYGPELRGIGGMDKRVFSMDFKAVDAEVERLRPLVDLGGYIPCPDHRIPPDAKWENVQYYCEQMRKTF